MSGKVERAVNCLIVLVQEESAALCWLSIACSVHCEVHCVYCLYIFSVNRYVLPLPLPWHSFYCQGRKNMNEKADHETRATVN